MNTQQILRELTCEYGLTEIKELKRGHTGSLVQLMEMNGTQVVLKLSTTKKGIRDIQENIRAYTTLKRYGYHWVTPTIVASSTSSNLGFIITEYVGETLLKRGTNIQQFKVLIEAFKHVYADTKVYHYNVDNYLIWVQQLLLLQLTILSKLTDVTVLTHELHKALKRIRNTEKYSIPFCFAPWDFTPENIIINDSKIQVIDLRMEIFGIPSLGLGAFVGLSRDVYKLNGATEGFVTIQSVVENKLEKYTGIPTNTLLQFFNLGLVLQNLLSARFRFKEQPKLAQNCVSLASQYLKQI